ncbi:MAG: DUF4198 domain-containing protein [Chloroherpetonaceae bacterium]|nr:DUF4198 domain-containing protein [Chloroherpetonaceae bacterium]MDW8019898.1 DUF4198 domain-containing protein [Chloroherpetonaceae bacterium]
MMRFCLTLFVYLIATTLYAHEFWLRPAKFRLKQGERTTLSLLVGENFTGEAWKFGQSTAIAFLQCHRSATETLVPVIKDGVAAPIELSFKYDGTYLIGLHTSPKFIELDAEKFAAYLKEEGLTDILALRSQKGDVKKPARELYRRCAKTLIQVGHLSDETASKELGFPLEIIPEHNPYLLQAGDAMRFRVVFNAKPLSRAQIKVWHRRGSKVTTTTLHTDELGCASFAIVPDGEWMISLVKMIEATDTAKADYESFWASLTFGYDR